MAQMAVWARNRERERETLSERVRKDGGKKRKKARKENRKVHR